MQAFLDEMQAEAGVVLPLEARGAWGGGVAAEAKAEASASKSEQASAASQAADAPETAADQHSKKHQASLQGFVVNAIVSTRDSKTIETWRSTACSFIVFYVGIGLRVYACFCSGCSLPVGL